MACFSTERSTTSPPNDQRHRQLALLKVDSWACRVRPICGACVRPQSESRQYCFDAITTAIVFIEKYAAGAITNRADPCRKNDIPGRAGMSTTSDQGRVVRPPVCVQRGLRSKSRHVHLICPHSPCRSRIPTTLPTTPKSVTKPLRVSVLSYTTWFCRAPAGECAHS